MRRPPSIWSQEYRDRAVERVRCAGRLEQLYRTYVSSHGNISITRLRSSLRAELRAARNAPGSHTGDIAEIRSRMLEVGKLARCVR